MRGLPPLRPLPWAALLLAACLLLPAPAWAQSRGEPQKLPSVWVRIGETQVQVSLALTPQQRQRGYMHYRSIGDTEGMLFVFDSHRRSCMWMRNTLVPLTVAWLTDGGAIVNTADMQPLSEKSHCSAKPVRLALEMRRGWFAERKLDEGAVLQGMQPLLRQLLKDGGEP